MSARSYLWQLLILVISGAAMVIVTVAVVDPYGLFDLVRIPMFNVEKTERLAGGGRFIKSIELSNRNIETLILGSSRTLQGISPSSPFLAHGAAYNGSIQGTDMHELHHIGLYAIEHQRLKRLIFGIDFHMFLTPQAYGGDFATLAFSGDPLPYVYIRRLLSVRALIDSGKTVIKNALGWHSPYLSDGSADRARVIEAADHRMWFDHRLRESYDTFPGRRYVPAAVSEFLELIERARHDGIQVYVFISPTHALHIEALAELGYYEMFEQWKRDITASVALANRRSTSIAEVQLWDFSGYNAITTEPLPARDQEAMQWYWESSHYKRETGDLVLSRMLGDAEGRTSEPPPDFGVRLTESNIAAHLAATRMNQAGYRASFPAKPTWVSGAHKRSPL